MKNTYFGRLVQAVEVKDVGDKKVTNNRLAIQVGKDKSTFVDIVAWGSNAEIIGKYYKKGNEILFQGELINKKTKVKDPNSDFSVEIDVVSILISNIIPHYGNGNKSSEGGEDIPQFVPVDEFDDPPFLR